MKLFSDKALISLYNMTHSTKPANKEYRKLREKIKQYPLSGKEPTGGIYANTRIVPYDIIEEFMNCPEKYMNNMSMYIDKKILIPAINELNECSQSFKNVSFQKIKEGGMIKKFEISFQTIK